MAGRPRPHRFLSLCILLSLSLAGFLGCAANSGTATIAPVAATTIAVPAPVAPRVEPVFPVMLGIDVLEAQGFAPIRGKRIGLLTHPAGVNRQGVSTIEVLHKATQVDLVALFAPEHSLYGDVKAGENINDAVDSRTGLPVYSLHASSSRAPSAAQLKGLDALVIDLQDIGVRSYTYNVTMRYAMEACFTHGVEVVLLDRPNPLGGLKVDGPSLDREHMSGVGAFRIPYVHGLTMAELARMAATAPGVLNIPDSVRATGKLTIVPMRGWSRAMRWPETGLRFVPTSPMIQDFAAVVGYAMVGLGCEYSGFRHGIGPNYPFRGISFRGKTADVLIRDLTALNVPGVAYRKVTVPPTNGGQPQTGVYVEVTDWEAWNPVELSFHLMRLACTYDPPNPFAKLNPTQTRSFNIHVGSTEWWQALTRDGARVNLEGFLQAWRERTQIYQQQTRRYWLYN